MKNIDILYFYATQRFLLLPITYIIMIYCRMNLSTFWTYILSFIPRIDIVTLLTNYGYIIVLLGSFVEGELIVLTAGMFAAKGTLNIFLVILYAFIGTLLSEQLLFFIGYRYGDGILDRFPSIKYKAKLALRLLSRHKRAFILSCRFIYGIRSISPILVGSSKTSPLFFAKYNILAAAVWAILSASIGYGGERLACLFNCSDIVHYIMLGGYCLINVIVVPQILLRVIKVYMYKESSKTSD